MKQFCYYLLLALPCIAVNAQTAEKTFLSASLQVVPEEALAQYYRVLEHNPESGYKVTVYYLNGQVKMTGTYTDADLTQEEGEFVYYYRNGQVESQGMFSEGVKFGVWKRYEWDGTEKPDKHYTGASAELLSGRNVLSEPPAYPGGEDSLQHFLRTNLVYPASCLRQGIQGTVLVSFSIDDLGYVRDVNIFEGVHYFLDREAERLAALMPRWIPAKKDGRNVESKFILPIPFVIPGEQRN